MSTDQFAAMIRRSPSFQRRIRFTIRVGISRAGSRSARGVLVGTREWDISSRNHCSALLAAQRISEATGEIVSVFEDSGRAHPRLLAEIGFPAGKLRVLTERTNYADYLRVVAEHKIVFQLDTSFVPGPGRGRCVALPHAVRRRQRRD